MEEEGFVVLAGRNVAALTVLGASADGRPGDDPSPSSPVACTLTTTPLGQGGRVS